MRDADSAFYLSVGLTTAIEKRLVVPPELKHLGAFPVIPYDSLWRSQLLLPRPIPEMV